MTDLAIGALTLLGAILLGARIYRALLTRWDDRPYWETMREALGEGCPPDRPHPVVVVWGVVDWQERGWA